MDKEYNRLTCSLPLKFFPLKFIIFPIDEDIVVNNRLTDLHDMDGFAGYLSLSPVFGGCLFKGRPIFTPDNIPHDIRYIFVRRTNEFVEDHMDFFTSLGKELVWFSLENPSESAGFELFEGRERDEGEKIAAFVPLFDYYALARMSQALKGYYRLAVIPADNRGVQVDFSHFDRVLYYHSKEEMHEILGEYNPDIMFTKALIGHYEDAAELCRRYKNVVVDSTDLPQFFFGCVETSRKDFGYDEEKAVEEISRDSLKFLIRYGASVQTQLNRFSVTKDTVEIWHEYATEVNFRDKNPVLSAPYNLLYCGVPIDPSLSDNYVGKNLLKMADSCSKQGMDFTFLVPPNYSALMLFDDRARHTLRDYLIMSYKDHHVTVHFGDVPERIAGIMGNYDYGLFPLIPKRGMENLADFIPSKFALYLEAGLPIIIEQSLTKLAGIIRSNGLGIVIHQSEVDNLKNILDKYRDEYPSMVHNVAEFRKSFTVESNLSKLMEKMGL